MQNNSTIVPRRGVYVELVAPEVAMVIRGVNEIIKIAQQKLLDINEEDNWGMHGMALVEYEHLLEKFIKANNMLYERKVLEKVVFLPLWPEHENEFQADQGCSSDE